MYSRQESSQLYKNFWTSFGQYMKPLRGADDQPVNWLNYKTGIKDLYFRMDADNVKATIAIELRHTDRATQEHYFEKSRQVKEYFHQTMGENWQWQLHDTDEDGRLVSRISTEINNVNMLNVNAWPAIISFLKPRMLALDIFWNMVKESFE